MGEISPNFLSPSPLPWSGDLRIQQFVLPCIQGTNGLREKRERERWLQNVCKVAEKVVCHHQILFFSAWNSTFTRGGRFYHTLSKSKWIYKNGLIEVFILSFTKEFAGMPWIGVLKGKMLPVNALRMEIRFNWKQSLTMALQISRGK